MSDRNTLLRSIPAMDELLNAPWALEFSVRMGREYVKKVLAEVLDDIRREISKERSATNHHDPLRTTSELIAERAEIGRAHV